MSIAKKSAIISIAITLCVVCVVSVCAVLYMNRDDGDGKSYATASFMYDIYDDSMNVAYADNVFAGEVLEIVSEGVTNKVGLPMREYKIRVVKSLKGNFESGLVVVGRQMGGYMENGDALIMDGFNVEPLNVKSTYIFCSSNMPGASKLSLGASPSTVELEKDFDPDTPESSAVWSRFVAALDKGKTYQRDRYTSVYDR